MYCRIVNISLFSFGQQYINFNSFACAQFKWGECIEFKKVSTSNLKSLNNRNTTRSVNTLTRGLSPSSNLSLASNVQLPNKIRHSMPSVQTPQQSTEVNNNTTVAAAIDAGNAEAALHAYSAQQ